MGVSNHQPYNENKRHPPRKTPRFLTEPSLEAVALAHLARPVPPSQPLRRGSGKQQMEESFHLKAE